MWSPSASPRFARVRTGPATPGKQPCEPSPSRTYLWPWRTASSNSGSLAVMPSNSHVPSRSNQSMPEVTLRRHWPGLRTRCPSASTIHPAWTSASTNPANRCLGSTACARGSPRRRRAARHVRPASPATRAPSHGRGPEPAPCPTPPCPRQRSPAGIPLPSYRNSTSP